MPQIEEITSALAEPESSLEASSSQKVALSIVVPVMNEEQNIRPLFQKLSDQLNSLGQNYEVIFVDDGSTDKTFRELKTLHEEHPGTVRVIRFRRNFGKTPALPG
jgi:glycosyltransferase involved in cell wall biosynthesis